MAHVRLSLFAALAVIGFAATVGGCFSFATVTTAEPVGQGRFEFTVAPTVTGLTAAGTAPCSCVASRMHREP